MISKTIHYCWFGKKKKSKLIKDCIESWKLHCPDFEIIEWNEKNTDLSLPFVQKAYKSKKWAFVSDYVRFKVLYEYGGIYLDTDMMVLKPLNDLLQENCFFGAEETEIVSCGIIGSKKQNKFIQECFLVYEQMDLSSEINWMKIIITRIVTDIFKVKYNFKESITKKTYNEITIYPPVFFYPLPFNNNDAINYKKYIVPESYAVHLWVGSWIVYNEFNFLRTREYLKGGKIIFNKLLSGNINYKYIRKVLSSLKESL